MISLFRQERVFIATPVLCVGGTEIQTLSLVRILVGAGYHVTLCCYYEFDQSLVVQFKEAGSEVILLHLDRCNGRVRASRILQLITKLISIITKYHPDIVHVQYIAPGLIPIIAARLSGVKRVFATIHQPGRIYGLKAKVLIHIAAHLCDVFFCNSMSVEQSWFGSSEIFDPNKVDSRRKHFTIYNGVDVDKIERIAKETHKEEIRESLNIRDKKVVGVVGRLRSEKGQATLLASMKLVIKEIPNAVLLVVGDGPDRPYLEDMAKKIGIDSNVFWLGQKDPDDVFKFYSIMDVLAVPSLFEGFGLTAVEAMAAGVPVIGTGVDGLSEIIEDGVTGHLVLPQDRFMLARRLIELLTNKAQARKMGLASHQRAREMFSMELFAESTLPAYHYFLRGSA